MSNFKVNMQFLERERKKATKAVQKFEDKSEDALGIITKMNTHMESIVQDLREVDGLVDIIKTKKQAL